MKIAAGRRPNTVRKYLAIVRPGYRWLYRQGDVSADTLLAIRAIPMPAGSSAAPHPRPYSLGELRPLHASLDERWPRLPEHQACRRAQRWREGRSPYSRVRRHAIRLQLEAIIALALQSGLRRSEIFALTVDAMHPDNACVVVSQNAVACSAAREVPFTRGGRQAVGEWLEVRSALGAEHTAPWLQLWSAQDVAAPMKGDAFARLLPTYIGAGWTLKRLRDTCAARWIDDGLPLEHTRQLLGLGSLEATLPYAALVTGTLESGVDRIDDG